MKRFTLFALFVALLSVTAFAQRRMQTLTLHPHSRTAKALSSAPSTPFNHVRRAPELTPVTPPEDLEMVEYAYIGSDDEDTPLYGYMQVGISGSDVYIQGLCPFLPAAWVKGTLADGKVTIPAGAYCGPFTYDATVYDLFLNYGEEDVVFQFVGDTNIELVNEVLLINDEMTHGYGQYYYAYSALSLMQVPDEAGTPQAPKILELAEHSEYGWYVDFNIPIFDTENRPISSEKLYSVVYVMKGDEVRALEFTPETHTMLVEPMTYLPYGFTEDYDFYVDCIYFNGLWSDDWDAVGIQSIYRGDNGDVTSEINWFSTEFPGFNFNKMKVETSSSTSKAGDITKNLTLESSKGKLTITPSGVDTANRFWGTANGPQLRVYGGTLTFTAPAGWFITGLEFDYNNGKWNAGNDFDSGNFDQDTQSKMITWEGGAQTVLLTIAGNSQFNSIKVYLGEPVELEAPADLQTEAWSWWGQEVAYGETGATPQPFMGNVKVGFYSDNTEVYIQGLNPFVPTAWVKGTVADGKVTIPAASFCGIYEYIDWEAYEVYTNYLYITAAANGDNGLVSEDLVFNYNVEAKTLTTDQYIFVVEDPEDIDNSCWLCVTENKLAFIPDEAVMPAAPAVVKCMIDSSVSFVSLDVPMTDVDGNPLLTEKLYYVIWIKKADGVPHELMLTTESYEEIDNDMTEIPYDFDDDYDIYAGGDMVYLNQNEEELASWKYIGVQSIYYGGADKNATEIAWYEIIRDGISSVQTGTKRGTPVIFNLSGQRVQTPQRGLYIIDGRKVIVGNRR